MSEPIIAAADGSALGNPGPAGWAWYIDEGRWASGGWNHGTNNMGELMAVLDLLRQTDHLSDQPLRVLCDSQYVINVITKWSAAWKRKGWRKADGKPVMNLELVQALDAAMAGRRVEFEWVKGHAGHPLNEAADERARAAAAAHQTGAVADPGPGFAGQRQASRSPQAAPTPLPEPQPDLFSVLDGSTTALGDFDTVITLERRLLDPKVRESPSDVAALLDPQWSEIGASGRRWSRSEMLAVIGPLDEVPEMDVVDVRWIDRESILLVWRSIGHAAEQLRSSVWRRENGQWRQLFHQGTPV